MVARNARMYPDEIALAELRPSEGMRKEITWRGFDERINRFANALVDRGISKGDKVIHWMMNSISWLEAYFGIIRGGAWAVPLNFRFTSQDLRYCADIAEAKAMILGEEFTERVEAIRSQLSTIEDYIYVGQTVPEGMEDFEDMISNSSPKPVDVGLKDEDECALYFTSGTTGAPKPILLTHKNMECAAITENYNHCVRHSDNFLLLQPLYHTGGKMHWFGSLIVGGRATLLGGRLTPQNILEAVHKERATKVMVLVPWIQDILTALDRGELRKEDYDLSCWRLMHSGAQPIPASLIKRWKEYFPNMQYDTDYGLGEATGPGCVHLGMENEHKVGAIGKASFNWEAHIVNEKGEVEKQIPGAVYITPEGTQYKTIVIPNADVSQEYTLIVNGTGSGMMEIKAQVPDAKNKVKRYLEYTNVPVSATTTARVKIMPDIPLLPVTTESDSVRDNITKLELDSDGDGVFELESAPGNFERQKMVLSVLKAEIDIEPDTFYLSGQPEEESITVCIELPKGYNPKGIDVGTIRLMKDIPAWERPTDIVDHDQDGIYELMVRFDRWLVTDYLVSQKLVEGRVSLTVTGIVDGRLFEGVVILLITRSASE